MMYFMRKDCNRFLGNGFWLGLGVGIFLVGVLLGGAAVDRSFGFDFLDRWFPPRVAEDGGTLALLPKGVLNEESVVIGVVEEATVAVVTVSISKVQVNQDLFKFFFGLEQGEEKQEQIEQDIGTGFVISKDGLIVTNRHVVGEIGAKYKVATADDQVYEVKEIYRDPVNDLAILKIEVDDLKPLELGDSDKLKVGQMVIAIGTALGEFRSTVTTGVISGLGRGITAEAALTGSERLDNVIQVDAAINPGNSGGPLLNSAGQVIGVNVAVASGSENIGFALPINIVRESIENFKATGEFERPFLGVTYRVISKKAAILNEVPQGLWVQQVVEGTPAGKAGIKEGDIMLEFDGEKLGEEGEVLVKLINKKKIGDEVLVKIWREGEEKSLRVKLEKRVEI